jgi:UDP-2,4-diacetamido-2,4,6-trideoxy-beta-L-altropyranose hydrolase
MRVIFRVDASLKMGTGHVMRCLALAQVLKKNGGIVEFICRKHEGNLIDKIGTSGFNVFELELATENKVDDKLLHSHWLGVTQKKDARDCINVTQSKKIDWLIVDHYSIDEEWQIELKSYCKELMVIDDLADRKHLCDILLDQTFGRERRDYEKLVPESCKLLLGSQYALLRPEFSKWREYSLKRRSNAQFKQLLINMGGIDTNNITEQILEEIENCILPNDISITVVMGGISPYLDSVKAKAITLPYKTEVKVDVDNMAEIMANADIAIGASGITTWERCCLGLPTIQLVIAKNQNTIAELLERKNAIKLLNNIKQLPSIMSNVIVLIKDLTSISRKISDGMGSTRVSSEIMYNKI